MKILIILLATFLLSFCSEFSQLEEKILEIPLFKDKRTFTRKRLSNFQRLIETKYLFSGRTKFISSGPPSIPLVTFKELQYWGHLMYGSQKQSFKMMFDTGSGWTWIPSEFCNGCQKFTQNSYSCSLSKTCKTTYLGTSIHYGKGDVKGRIVYDDVWINKDKKAPSQPFLLVYEANNMPKLKFDGISGLGFRIMCAGLPTIVDTLYESGVIAKKSFSVYLESLKTNSYKSALVFGGINKKYMGAEKFHTCNVISSIYWAINLDYVRLITSKKEYAIGIEGAFEDRTYIKGYKSVIDTGTSLIHLHRHDFIGFARAFLKMVPNCFFNGGLHLIECFNTGQEFPVIKFSFCGKEFKVNPISYLYGNMIVKLVLVSSVNLNRPVNIMGDVLMKEYYFDFNQEDRTIGIMPKGRPKKSI